MSAELHRANASYLPYKSSIFDTVVHMGGINTFGEKKKAVDEMLRVAKTGAKIAIVDEGLKPGKEKTLFGKFMLKTNPLYAHKPPIEILPPDIKDLEIRWIWGDIFYFMSFRK
ncbi:MAG: methyltransferase domain-containing protein [Candidatus Bathyarchaeia archaeon]